MSEISLLLVDDEAEFRQGVCTALTHRGFQVVQAENGWQALQMIQTAHPDLVVLDLRMPEMDGIETLRRLRRDYPDLPVVILTGHGDFHDALVGVQLGIVDFLQKPVDVDELSEHVHHLLAEGRGRAAREKTVGELMASHLSYPRIYDDQLFREALELMRDCLTLSGDAPPVHEKPQTILVFDRRERFVGCLTVRDVLKTMIPMALESSPYACSLTGMFLAQAKLVGNQPVSELLDDQPSVSIRAPLLEALHVMLTGGITDLPVLAGKELLGMLRDRDLVLEIVDTVVRKK